MLLDFQVIKGDLFSDLANKKGVILTHSCNAQGRWGSGVAKVFHSKFKQAYELYRTHAQKVGDGFVVEENGYRIGCLITSKGYGAFVDPPKKIAENTYLAIKALLDSVPENEIEIHSPKINAGLFNTPWSWTKKSITKACDESDKKIKWIVWEL